MPAATAAAPAAAAAAAAAAASKKEAEAAKRARRRAAQKAVKQEHKAKDDEWRKEAAAAAATGASSRAKEEGEGGDEQKDGGSGSNGMDVSADGSDARVKSESGSASAAAATVLVEDLIDVSSNPAFAEFSAVLSAFHKRAEDSSKAASGDAAEEPITADHVKSKEERIDDELREQSGEGAVGGGETLSKRKQKERDRLAISDLKQLVAKPEVVELHDANSADPKLLVYLKSYRNSVPVPSHWSQKRKYLQNKRGYEKAPFQLPACIENTGITKMRGAQQEKDKDATNKQKQRAKMQPKMGKIDIDYQILHDAFFRYQTKPAMTEHGALYYEGREHELKMTEKKPCSYSPALREALGMKDETAPPPWLIAIQRYGPPPAYPNLRIPGVSAPIPLGARYGFGEGEWGKPPVDINGRPLYGDVFGIERKSVDQERVDTTLWGVLDSEGEEEDEEPAADDEEEKGDEGATDMDAEQAAAGTASTLSGLTTPEMLSLRKVQESGTETPDTVAHGVRKPQQLYQVLEEKKASVGAGMFGTSHTYDLTGVGPQTGAGLAPPTEQERRVEALRARARAQVDVALNPDELEGLDAAGLKRKYDARVSADADLAKKALVADDDDDDDDGAGGKKKKRRKAGAGAEAKNKAYKDFKF